MNNLFTTLKEWEKVRIKRMNAYYNKTKYLPPHKLTVKALRRVHFCGYALDMGSGAFRDTKLLLNNFIYVEAVDKECVKPPKGVFFFKTTFEKYSFRKFNFINAYNSLPFLSPKSFPKVWARIEKSLLPGGVFCGTFFGKEDEWANKKTMTFLTSKKVKSLFKNMKVLHFKEIKKQGETALGKPKYWHIYEVIAKREGAGNYC